MFSTVLMAAGGIALVVGNIMIAIAAFKESVLWGIGSLIVPLVLAIFVFTHWQQAKTGFFWSLAGAALLATGGVLSPDNPLVS